MKHTAEDYLLSSVKNALRILRSFSLDEPEKKVTELASSLGLSKSTVSRLLHTLASEGFVTKDPETQKYRLGLTILQLNTVLTSHLEINREAQPILKKLVDDLGETAHLAMLDDQSVIYIHRVESRQPVQALSHVGRRNPLHCTSSGKVLLAHQKEEDIEAYIQHGLTQFTLNTMTDPRVLREALHAVRRQGYAISIEELREGVASIAAPIRDYTGKVAYALSVIGPVHRFHPYNPGVIAKVKRAANEISEKLGYWPPPSSTRQPT